MVSGSSSMEALDERQIELEGRLMKHSVELLTDIAANLSLTPPATITRYALLRTIRNHTESKTEVTEKENLLTAVEALCLPDLEGETGDANGNASIKDEDDDVEETDGSEAATLKKLEKTLNKTTLKKEFRISGTIGPLVQKGDKDKAYLGYISLIHQIETGQRLKYTDEEIIAGVIKAMSANLRLRTVIETLPKLKLPRLRLMLRSHFHEKPASVVFSELSKCSQLDDEEPDEFLMKAYELRQKLLFASKEVGSMVQYDLPLIQSVFVNAVETGLISDSIRSRIRPYLMQPRSNQTADDFEVQNDQLMHQMNLAKLAEDERSAKASQTKGNREKKGVKGLEVPGSEDSPKPSKEDAVLAALEALTKSNEALKGQLNNIKSEVNQFKSQQQQQRNGGNQGNRPPNNRNGGRPRPKCTACRTNNVEYCDHCVRCGSGEHYVGGCRAEPQGGASNGPRPQ